MNLSHFLAHKRRYETLLVVTVLLVNLVVDITTKGIERIRNEQDPNWIELTATESTSILMIGLLLPFLFMALNRLDLRMFNWRHRAVLFIPLFLIYSLSHVFGFVLLRKFLWALAGDHYAFDDILLGLLYELRKDLLDFLLFVAIFYAYQFILNRLQGEATFPGSDPRKSSDAIRNQFLVKMLDREYLLKTEDIDWIQSASNYALLHCDNRQFPMRSTLKALEGELDPEQFMRVHRTAIVNLQRVRAVVEGQESSVELADGQRIPVSKTYLTALRRSLKNRATG